MTVKRIDPDGAVVRYHYTKERYDEDCSQCRAGSCTQRVEESNRWAYDLVVHCQQASLN